MSKDKNISNALLLRTLSMKSRLGFGDIGNLLIAEVIKAGKSNDLVWAYYNLSMISFSNDVLDAIGISEKDRIAKPGKDPELGDKIIKSLETKSLEGILKTNKHKFINQRDYLRKKHTT